MSSLFPSFCIYLQADVICVVYACDNDDSIARVNI